MYYVSWVQDAAGNLIEIIYTIDAKGNRIITMGSCD